MSKNRRIHWSPREPVVVWGWDYPFVPYEKLSFVSFGMVRIPGCTTYELRTVMKEELVLNAFRVRGSIYGERLFLRLQSVKFNSVDRTGERRTRLRLRVGDVIDLAVKNESREEVIADLGGDVFFPVERVICRNKSFELHGTKREWIYEARPEAVTCLRCHAIVEQARYQASDLPVLQCQEHEDCLAVEELGRACLAACHAERMLTLREAPIESKVSVSKETAAWFFGDAWEPSDAPEDLTDQKQGRKA